MKKILIKALCLLLPISAWRKWLRHHLLKKFQIQTTPKRVRESALAHQYLDGLNGIEIGASTQNGFGLDKTDGAYATVDFEATQGGKWQASGFKPANVDVVANGDNLPFKDNSLDYVLSSHVIEHFFDPIKAIHEWLRVIRSGGYIFIIVPHKERTFDCNRETTSLDELINRHNRTLTICDYAYKPSEFDSSLGYGIDKPQELLDTPYRLIADKEVPEGWVRFNQDDHHHWTVWTTNSFLNLCRYMDLRVVEAQDPDDKIGNGFTIVIKK